MRIIIETPKDDEEDEIIIRCSELDDEIMNLILTLKKGRNHIIGYDDKKNIIKLSPKEIYYFESVDNRVFAYCEKDVYEIKMKLYEIENDYKNSDFLRISKSVIANISRINFISPMLGARFEANMKNGEKIIISRQYVSSLKKKLGI